MSAYTVIWSGSSKQSLPGLSGEGWQQKRGSYLTSAAERDGAKRSGDLLSKQEMVGKTELDGMQVRESPAPAPVQEPARALWMETAPQCACGRVLTLQQNAAKVRRCVTCQRAKRNMRKVA